MNHEYLEIMEKAKKYVAKVKPILLSPDDVAAFAKPMCQDEKQETLYAIYLNTRNEVISFEIISRGLADRTSIHAREVFREAIIANAVRLLLVHNHPSGDPKPSQGDITSTQSLVEAGKIIGIEVIDHIIVGTVTEERTKYFSSLRELGYI